MVELKIINLDRRTDRWKKIQSQLDTLLKDSDVTYERISAIDGKEATIDPKSAYLLKNNALNMKRAAYAYFMTNFKLWQELLSGNQPFTLIFDDDVTFCPNFVDKLHQTISLATKAEYQFDVCLIGYVISSTNPKYTLPNLPITLDLMGRHPYYSGSFGYMLTRRGATKLVSLVKKAGFPYPVDTIFLHGMRNPRINLTIMCTLPRLVFTEVAMIGNQVDSDIQRDPSKIDLKLELLILSPLNESIVYNQMIDLLMGENKNQVTQYDSGDLNIWIDIGKTKAPVILCPFDSGFYHQIKEKLSVLTLVYVTDIDKEQLDQDLFFRAKHILFVTTSSVISDLIKSKGQNCIFLPKIEELPKLLDKSYLAYYSGFYN